jgi:hypothetical protein
MQFCMAHKQLQPNVSSMRKITGSPRLQKKIFGCAEVLRRNDETLGSDASSGRAAPGRRTKPPTRICASAGLPGCAPRAGHRWHSPTRALPHFLSLDRDRKYDWHNFTCVHLGHTYSKDKSRGGHPGHVLPALTAGPFGNMSGICQGYTRHVAGSTDVASTGPAAVLPSLPLRQPE